VIKKDESGITLKLDLLSQCQEEIYSNYSKKEIKFLKFIFNILSKTPNNWLQNRALLNHFTYFFPSISTGEKKTLKKNDDQRGSRGGSHPPSPLDHDVEPSSQILEDVRLISPDRAKQKLPEGKEDFGIWISTNKLDHVHTWNGKFNLTDPEEGSLWTILEREFNPEYNATGWAYPIREENDYLLKIHLHKNTYRHIGTVRIFIERFFNPEIIFQENYFRIFHFFTPEQHKSFLEELQNEKNNNPLFYVELANAIGPKHVVDEKFKKAHLKCYLHNGKGGNAWVDITIDYSLNRPEIEFKGPYLPTANLRDVTTEPARFVDSVLFMEANHQRRNRQLSSRLGVIDSNIYSNGQILQQIPQQLDFVYNDIAGLLTKQEILQDLHFVNLEEYLKGSFKSSIGVLNGMNNNIGLLGHSLKHFYNFVDAGLDTVKVEVSDQLNTLQENISDQFRDLKSDLKDFITKEFSTFRKDFVNNLYLVLKKIHDLPEITSRELISKLKSQLEVSEGTLYRYLRKLEEQGLIASFKVKTSRRIKRAFKLSNKIKKLIKKLGK